MTPERTPGPPLPRWAGLLRAALSVLALASIAAGLYAIFPPAAFVIVGGLIWSDLR